MHFSLTEISVVFSVLVPLHAMQEVTCMRLLKKFSPKHFEPKSFGLRSDDPDAEEAIQLGKRGQITDQLVELPIMHQAYDMIHGEQELASNEVFSLSSFSAPLY